MLELRHQLGSSRLVGIVALNAVGRCEWLALMGFLEIRILCVVAIEAERGCPLGEMELVVHRRFGAGFVSYMAGVTAHIERGMTTAFFRDIQTCLVTTQAEVFPLVAGFGLQELILVVAGVRIVAGKAVADRRRMHHSLDVCRLFVGMACEAKVGRSGSDEYYPRDIFIDPDLMAAQTSCGHCGMNGFALGFVVMTFQAFGGIGLGVERDWMNSSAGPGGKQSEQRNQDDAKPCLGRRRLDSRLAVIGSGNRFVKPDAMHEHSHTAIEGSLLHSKVALMRGNASELQCAARRQKENNFSKESRNWDAEL
jgi:hypothetical protein